jgi:hypothetical protein
MVYENVMKLYIILYYKLFLNKIFFCSIISDLCMDLTKSKLFENLTLIIICFNCLILTLMDPTVDDGL